MTEVFRRQCDMCGKMDPEEGEASRGSFTKGPELNVTFGTLCGISSRYISGVKDICPDCRAIVQAALENTVHQIYVTSWRYRNRVLPQVHEGEPSGKES